MADADTAEQQREQLNTGTKPVAESHRFDETRLLAWMQAGRAPGYLRVLGLGVLVLAGIALVAASVTGQVRL